MGGLNGALSIASQALAAQYAGLAVANNNIANANTVGYARQVVSLSANASVQGGVSTDQGVSYEGYTSVRDNVLGLAVNGAISEQNSLSAQSSVLEQVNGAFSGTDTGIGASMSTLFSDLSALSTSPSDPSARQAVFAAAQQVATAFQQGSTALSDATNSADQQVRATVAKINELSGQIASVQGQLATLTSAGQDGGALEDQRTALVSQLAALTNVGSTATETTPTLTTGTGSPLVVGNVAYSLQVSTGTDGLAHVLNAQGQDITSELTGGTLGGAITVRDQTRSSFSQDLNSLASEFATAINAAQASGYDSNGLVGRPMFSFPGGASNAAATLSVALTSGAGVAASSDGSSGSSGNIQNLLAVQSSKLSSGSTPTDAYANLVGNIGSAGSEVSSNLSATTASLQQLQSQQDSMSGVSIDEETTNLVRFQQAYTAAAKVVSTISSLYTVLNNMVG